MEYTGRHLLVLAGAGSGKTRTIISRAKYLIDHGTRPSRILILSFTRKSAREIVSRINASLTKSTKELRGQTFHSWCKEIINRNPAIFPNASYSLLDEEDAASCFALLCGKSFKKEALISPEELHEVYSYMVNTRCNLSTAIGEKLFYNVRTAGSKEEIATRRPIYEDVIRRYMAYKKEHSYLDYDDLMISVAMAMSKSADIQKYIATHYDHILVDEMQDTNPLQYLLLSQFATHCHLFCVGDDAQSIYAFRGADFNSIHNFTSRFPDAEIKKLTVNYRSSQEILNLSNWMLHHSPLNYDKFLTAAAGNSGILPALIHYEEDMEQASDIVSKIRTAHEEERLPYSQNMVISRSLYGLRRVETCLIEAKIPYKIFGGTSIMQSAHVRDVVSALRIACNHRDELAWMRYLCLWPGIGERKASKIIDAIKDQQTMGGILMKLDHKQLVPTAVIETLAEAVKHSEDPAKALSLSLGNMENLLAQKYIEDWERRRDDFTILSQVAAQSQSISAFIQEYTLDPKAETGLKEESDGDDDAVVLTTIHQAKGLEATNVYIVDVSWTKYPNVRAVTKGPDAIEEERRCLYVALTRARKNLYLYRTAKAMRADHPGDTGPQSIYFLNGLPDDLVNIEIIKAPPTQWNTYQGKPMDTDDLLGDFDFS